mmetsp:Transcript_28768/g.92623  ORF Transcript_28768/g.92623 Transcript_28768/m.92623 type:complete len:134 (-) Transcript_28768:198-599(-)
MMMPLLKCGVVASFALGFVAQPRVCLRPLSAMPLTEANVESALRDAREELQQLFGYQEENRQVGITGAVDLVELDGPTVVLRLSGRFWHERSVVLARIGNFLTAAIPEICDVQVEDPAQLDDADPTPEEANFD